MYSSSLSMDLFGDPIGQSAPKSKPEPAKFDSRSYDRAFAKRVEKQSEKKAQISMFEEPEDATMYMSGVSSITDIKGCIQANTNICVNTIDITPNGTKKLIEHLNSPQGNLVFIDSGAFRVIGTQNDKAISFDDVFAYYNNVAFKVKYPERLTICAPDIIGDQQASVKLQSQYKSQIDKLIAHGINVIFPLQRGQKSLTHIYHELCATFGEINVIAGLPAAIKAIPHDEFMRFLDANPPRVHILGANKNKAIVKQAQHRSPTTQFSCDSNRLLAYIGKGRPLTDLSHDLTDTVVDFYTEVIENVRGQVDKRSEKFGWIPNKHYACTDFTVFEAESAILSFSTQELQDLCEELKPYLAELKLTPNKLICIVHEQTILDFITEEYNDGFSYVIHNIIWDYYRETLQTKLTRDDASPIARTQAIKVSCDNDLFE